MRPTKLLAALLGGLLAALAPAAHSDQLTRVFVGRDGLAHYVDGGRDRAAPREVGQVGVADPRRSADGRSIGWLTEERNCCTSYPIPLRLAVRRAGRTRIISDGWMISGWAFARGGREVALSTGVVHGATQRSLGLYDVTSGRRLAQWAGTFAAPPPAWAKGLTR